MIIPGPGHDIRPHAEPDRGFWDAPDFGGHVMVAAWAPDRHDASEASSE